MRKHILIGIVIALAVAPALLASEYSSLYVLPVASHTSGVNGTQWRTDVAIQNFQSSPITVQLLFIESGFAGTENIGNLATPAVPNGTITVPANGSVIVKDIVNGYQGKSEGIIGSIVASADKEFAMTSRVYNTGGGAGTFGQTVAPVRDLLESSQGSTDLTTAVAYIPGLTSNSSFRTNLGFVAGAGPNGMTINAKLRGADGTELGNTSFSVAANAFQHLQFSTSLLSATSFDAGSAEFRITAGSGAVAPYASVTDNLSGDSVFINGLFPPNTFPGAMNLFRAAAARWIQRR
jgi:hypothetical protein